MKAMYKSMNGRLVIESERSSIKDLFRDLAEIQEILDADQACGVCGGTNLRYRVRHHTKANKTFEYFELVCAADNCRAVLEFGQKQDMVGLFPRRKDEQGWRPNRGWTRFTPQSDAAEPPPPRQQQPSGPRPVTPRRPQ